VLATHVHLYWAHNGIFEYILREHVRAGELPHQRTVRSIIISKTDYSQMNECSRAIWLHYEDINKNCSFFSRKDNNYFSLNSTKENLSFGYFLALLSPISDESTSNWNKNNKNNLSLIWV